MVLETVAQYTAVGHKITALANEIGENYENVAQVNIYNTYSM